ncbi:hypothetical protein [Streptomyces antimycoticus]|uniref:hypothetical protein n=1 Tax=Streptomyces antimycoticus TaxID=68175 RepID=UPI0036AD1452
MPYSPVTKADSGVRGVKGPQEKTVAVTSVGSLPDTELCKAAADADIPYKDLKVINGGGGEHRRGHRQGRGGGHGQRSPADPAGPLRHVPHRRDPDFHHVSLVALANTPWVRYVPAADNTARPGRLVWSVAA